MSLSWMTSIPAGRRSFEPVRCNAGEYWPAKAAIRPFHEKVNRALRSIVDSLWMNGHSSGMRTRTITSGLVKALFCVTLLVSLILYPPSSAHAHSSAHGPAMAQNADGGHHGGHGAHSHHNMGEAQGHKTASAGDTTADTPNCCQGICMAAVLVQNGAGLPEVHEADHEATWLSSFSPCDPVEQHRPPKHLI